MMRKKIPVLGMVLLLAVLCGCITTPTGGNSSLGSQGSAVMEEPSLAPLQPIKDAPEDELPSLAPLEPLGPELKNADWIMQVDDTQDYTYEGSGIRYHCQLYLYASKTGGTDVLGHYTAQIVLKMEPDAQQLAAMLAEDGEIVDSLSGGDTRFESIGATFDMVAYSAKSFSATLKEIAPNQPLLQMALPGTGENAMALKVHTMSMVLTAPEGTSHDENGNEGAGWGGGSTRTVEQPIVILVNGGTAYVTFPKYEFERPFKGTIVGTVR